MGRSGNVSSSPFTYTEFCTIVYALYNTACANACFFVSYSHWDSYSLFSSPMDKVPIVNMVYNIYWDY